MTRAFRTARVRCGPGLVVLTGLVLLGGCTSEDPTTDPPPSAPSTAATSPSPSPSPSPSESTGAPRPQPWQVNSRAGAIAFAGHWFEVFSAAMPTGDVAELRSISAPDCVTCTSFADRLEAIYDNGGFWENTGWRVTRVNPSPDVGLPPGQTELLLRVYSSAERLKESRGAEAVVNSAGTRPVTARVEWVSGAWQMQSLVVIS